MSFLNNVKHTILYIFTLYIELHRGDCAKFIQSSFLLLESGPAILISPGLRGRLIWCTVPFCPK